jgi:hypothetical protein
MSQIADHRRHALPKGWKESIKSGMINAISLARYVACRTRGEGAGHADLATRSRAELDQYEDEITLLLEAAINTPPNAIEKTLAVEPLYPVLGAYESLSMKGAAIFMS